MSNWKESIWNDFEEDKSKIVIKENIFDYKDNFIERPLCCNSFVGDFETYKGEDDNPNPITTIISYSHLSYVSKQTIKDRRKVIPNFIKEYEGNVIDIVNDTDKNLSEEDKEIQMYEKFFDDMINRTKKLSDSKNRKIFIFMFNNSRYDNSYLIKILVKLGYKHSLDGKFHHPIKNIDDIKPYQDKINELELQLKDKEDKEEIDLIKEEITNNRDIIKRLMVEDKSKFFKEYVLLSNDDVKQLSLSFVYKGYIFHLKDICCFLKCSLKDLGETIGCKKEKEIGDKYFQIDYKTLTDKQWEEYRYYSDIDTKILWLSCKKFSNLIEFDNQRIMTISSLSLHNWKKLEPENRQFYKINYLDWEVGNSSYRGGFSFVNEHFIHKKVENVHSYDINSSYPSSMMEVIPFEEILESEVDDIIKRRKVVKLHHIRFDRFKLREDMIPIIPNLQQGINNSFYKDYDVRKSIEIYKRNKSRFKKSWNELTLWVWEEELEWFKKFYNDMKYEILETRYFQCKRLFTNYINHYYITKSQSDVDKIFCSFIYTYLKNRDKQWIEKHKKLEFDRYFNEKNNLLDSNKPLDWYWNKYCNVIDKYVNIIDNSTEEELKQLEEDINYQLTYIDLTRKTTKLYLNTLYGKFGQKPIQETHIHLPDEYQKGDIVEVVVDDNTKEKHTYRIESVKKHKILDKFVYSVIRTDKEVKKCNNVYISSYITMLSRMKLYDVIYKYGNKTVLYGDTDSIKMFDYLDDSYINNTTLGKWKYEGTYKKFGYIGSKKYMNIDSEGNFDYKISGINRLSDEYSEYDKEKLIDLFLDCNLKVEKKQTEIHKETGEKIIKDKPVLVNLERKDLDVQFVSIDKQYEMVKNNPVVDILEDDNFKLWFEK